MHDARTHLAAAQARRLAALRGHFDTAQIDALLVTHLPNVFYLSGFTGTSARLLVTPQAQHFIADFRYHGRLGTEVPDAWQLADCTGRRLPEVLAGLLPPQARLGIEADHTTLTAYHALKGGGHFDLYQTRQMVEFQRLCKDELELAALRPACAIGARVFTELLPLLGSRVSEADIAAEIEYRARRHGASACSFKPIVASGARTALPHAGFTTAPLQPGVPLVVDMGVVADGYCSDMTRTVFLGDCPAPWRELYALVDAAREQAQAALRPGITGCAADAVARELIAAAGHGARFGHGLGHGVGLEIHEDPWLHSGWHDELEEGNVVTCEPGVYLPGQGGIRIENMCAITADGVEQLTPLDTALMVM